MPAYNKNATGPRVDDIVDDGLIFFFFSSVQFQSLTNLPCGLESNNNIGAAGVSMDEEDASADDDEHIRTGLLAGEKTPVADRPAGKTAAMAIATTGNGINNNVLAGSVGGGGGIEKIRIDYPKKYHPARSMSLSMERNAFCEMCRVSRSPVPFDLGGGDNGGDGADRDDDKGVRRYFGFTLRQYMALGSLALVDFLGFCSMSVMAPTFPKEVSGDYVQWRHFGYRVGEWVNFFFFTYSFLKPALMHNLLVKIDNKKTN